MTTLIKKGGNTTLKLNAQNRHFLRHSIDLIDKGWNWWWDDQTDSQNWMNVQNVVYESLGFIDNAIQDLDWINLADQDKDRDQLIDCLRVVFDALHQVFTMADHLSGEFRRRMDVYDLYDDF